MTTNKPGTVTQQPLFGCTSCYEDVSYPADHLHVYNGECWCESCWCEIADWRDWIKLEPFRPALKADYERLQADHERLQAECEKLRSKTRMGLGVGDGGGSLFVHGDYDSIKRVQALIFECEKLRKDAEKRRRPNGSSD